uniref:(northern house mosquito) hypothetical protein n=1 Tax=Culex pipiens TaxID=7175 RepID=A0A8D8HVL5_CULPI
MFTFPSRDSQLKELPVSILCLHNSVCHFFFLSHSPATERSHKSHHKINFSNAVLVPDPSRWFPNPRVLSCRFSEKTTEWEVSVYEEKRRIHRKRMLSGKKREFASYRYGHYTL